MSIASDAHRFCSTFEAEVLLELLLRFWDHPFATDREYRNDLIEKTTEALSSAMDGAQIVQELPAEQTNFVAAVWYAELIGIDGDNEESDLETNPLRREWLSNVKSGLPSCFCDQSSLG